MARGEILSLHFSFPHANIATIAQVRPSDLDRYNLPQQCRLDMTEHDKKMGEELLREPFIQKNPAWVRELEIMMKSEQKAEIQVRMSLLYTSGWMDGW